MVRLRVGEGGSRLFPLTDGDAPLPQPPRSFPMRLRLPAIALTATVLTAGAGMMACHPPPAAFDDGGLGQPDAPASSGGQKATGGSSTGGTSTGGKPASTGGASGSGGASTGGASGSGDSSS